MMTPKEIAVLLCTVVAAVLFTVALCFPSTLRVLAPAGGIVLALGLGIMVGAA